MMQAGADDWRARAEALELEDRLAEAEQVIKDGIPHAWFAYATADLYATRMRRLRAQGDQARASEAHARARQWVRFYASMATSGGEGAAFSDERDRFLAELGEDAPGASS